MNTSFIVPIQPWSLGQTEAAGKIQGQNGVGAFKETFKEVITNVKTTENNLAEQQYLLATGQLEDPHNVMLAASEAQLSVDMLVALRDKALQSYNELMRISL